MSEIYVNGDDNYDNEDYIYIYIWSHLISHHTGMNVAHIDMNTDESIWFHTRVSACALAGVCVCTGFKACVAKNVGVGIW